jgi:aryl-alcohol dehydrogenase-like predicted oxidoreductase
MNLCLGTVQLGLNYGINNQIKRQPTSKEGYQILRAALKSGIKYLDTASAYGSAEKLIGESGVLNNGTMHVITKLDARIHSGLIEEMKKSLARLGQEPVDGLLLHDASNYYDKLQLTELLKIKEQRLAQHIGVSVYEPQDALKIVSDGIVDYIQIPYNVFDQRLDHIDFFQVAKKNNIKVFARSSFLQGLILMEPDNIPSKLDAAKMYVKKYRTIVYDYGFSIEEAAMLFSYTHEGIYKVVFGVDTVEQLKDNLEIVKKADQFEACRKALIGIADGISEQILNPSLWEV